MSNDDDNSKVGIEKDSFQWVYEWKAIDPSVIVFQNQNFIVNVNME